MKDVFRELEMIDFDGKLSSVTWLEIFLEGWGTGERVRVHGENFLASSSLHKG